MSRKIHCTKLKKEAEGLEFAPYPGAMGERIFNEISKEAWDMWLSHQTLLINENRLSLMDPKAREFLMTEMDKFLFQDNYEMPEGYTPPSD
ncbi:MAG: oxidative damage protection protein [Pseudomonadota bacterium]